MLLKEENVVFTQNEYNNTCRIYNATHSINLGSFGLLIGFAKDTVIAAGVYKDSGRVNINQYLQYITIGCDAVNTSKNFNRYGQRSNVIATLPIETHQSLNGT